MDAYPRRVAEGRALFQQGIEAAATLGAKTLVWHGARREQVTTDEGWERFIALTRELATACGEAGITLAVENVSNCALAQVRNVVTFATRLNELGSPREIGFVFDPFQAAEAGANPFMMLAAMGNRIVNVHISDFSEHNPGARHLPPGDGDLPWSALVRAIAGSGYSGPMMIEGALGADDTVITRVREHLTPLIRSVFPFSPDANRHEDDDAVSIQSALPAGVRKGITLFNERRFFEQHEEIEHEWHAERGPVRRLYQGILQIGVGFYHTLNGNHRGAMLLLTDGIEKTSAFTPHALGINTSKLVAEAQLCLDQIAALGPDRLAEFDAALIPTIELDED
jgi:sugar phosphate isomerase/epimerase